MGLHIDMQTATWGFAEGEVGPWQWGVGRMYRDDATLLPDDKRFAARHKLLGRTHYAQLAAGPLTLWVKWGRPEPLKQPGIRGDTARPVPPAEL